MLLKKMKRKKLAREDMCVGHFLLWAAYQQSPFLFLAVPQFSFWKIICCTYIAVRPLLLLNPISLTPLQVIFLRKLPNKPPTHDVHFRVSGKISFLREASVWHLCQDGP